MDGRLVMAKPIEQMTVDELLSIRHACDVCVGYHPLWYGHDRNPPCQGAAKEEILARARRWEIREG